jgi:hypothetical protein
MILTLAATALLAGSAGAQQGEQGGLEHRIRTRFQMPSTVVGRIDLLAANASPAARRVQLVADDETREIILRVPESYGSPAERELLIQTLNTAVDRMDVQEPKIDLHLAVVQTDLLDDAQFDAMDRSLRGAAPNMLRTMTLRGITWRSSRQLDNLEIHKVNETMTEAMASTQKEPVTVTGSLVPRILPDGRLYLWADLEVKGNGIAAEDGGPLRLRGNAGLADGRPLVLVGGKWPDGKKAAPDSPRRYPVMVYVHGTTQGPKKQGVIRK